MIDLHCHILHGLDDGAKSLDEAVEMAGMAEKDGISQIVATPHLYRGEFTPKDLGIIERKIEELNYVLQKNHIDVEIIKGAEVHIAHNLIDEIKKNRNHLVLNSSSYIILEFPAGHVFSGVKELLFELLSEGLRPIIAHPERNYVFMRNPELLYELVRAGALTQANSGSFTGLYGSKVEETAFNFMEHNLTHFMGSDAHNPRPSSMWFSQALKNVENRTGSSSNYLVNDNPHSVLMDQEIVCYKEPIDPRMNKKSLKFKIPKLFRKKEGGILIQTKR